MPQTRFVCQRLQTAKIKAQFIVFDKFYITKAISIPQDVKQVRKMLSDSYIIYMTATILML